MKRHLTKKLFCVLSAICLGWVSQAAQANQNRIVSLDYCADQFTLGLAPRRPSLPLDGCGEASYMRAEAKGLPQVKPSAENVLAYQPCNHPKLWRQPQCQAVL